MVPSFCLLSTEVSIHASNFLYLLMGLIALILVLIATPIVKLASFKYGKFDAPSERKVHRQPISRLGGIAIFLSVVTVLFIGWQMGWIDGDSLTYKATWISLVCGSIGFFCIGLYDDLLQASPLMRLILQFGIASLVWAGGVRLETLAIPGLETVQIGWLSLPITAFWITGIVNAINWIDGLDGLAAGISGIATISTLILCLYTGQFAVALIVVALLGSLLGFLVYNFNPAQIFMGDGGSYFIGFLLASTTLTGLVDSSNAVSLLLPLMILAVPVVDMISVIFDRLRRGASPFLADNCHLHHRLLQLGLSHRATVLTIYALAFWSNGIAFTVAEIPNSLIILGTATGVLGYMAWDVLRLAIPGKRITAK